MPIGKNSISRVAEGIESPNAAPMNVVETPAEVTVEVEKKIVESTAEAITPEKGEATVATEIEKKIVESTAKKPATKKPATKKPATKKAAPKTAKKPAAKKAEGAPAAEQTKAPELIGQAVAAPAPKKRGRKPGSKNKPKAAVAPVAESKPRTRRVAKAASAIAIGEELPVYLL